MKNKKVLLKGMSLVAAATILTTSLSGCGKKSYLLEDTSLSKTQVMYLNDQVLIVKLISNIVPENTSIYCTEGNHYKDVITGNVYHVHKKEYQKPFCKSSGYIAIPGGVDIEPLVGLLTEEELKKAESNKFTDNDLISLQLRLNKEVKEKSLSK